MFKPITRDENVVIILMLLFGALYSIFARYLKTPFSGKFAIIILMLFSGYLLFNRQVKVVANRLGKRKTYYPVTAVITETKDQSFGYGAAKGKYPVSVIEYRTEDGKMCTKELHNFFSARKIKTGQTIDISVNRGNSDDIAVRSSDTFLFVLLCVIGVIFESVFTVMLINIK